MWFTATGPNRGDIGQIPERDQSTFIHTAGVRSLEERSDGACKERKDNLEEERKTRKQIKLTQVYMGFVAFYEKRLKSLLRKKE